MKSKRCSSLLLAILIVVAAVGALPAAGQIQVTSTDPSAAPQGTTNLNVTISGSGFKKGTMLRYKNFCLMQEDSIAQIRGIKFTPCMV